MTDKTLQKLAAEKFPELSSAEKRLVNSVAAGEIAEFGDPIKKENDPENHPHYADSWTESRILRAEVAALAVYRRTRQPQRGSQRDRNPCRKNIWQAGS